jgi:hypothetical protein
VSFQIKDFLSIVLSQINHAKSTTTKINDFMPGSVARTMMEAPAVEIEELYLQMFLGLRDAIPVATFLSFGFTALPAARAHGHVSIAAMVERPMDFTIPAGAAFVSVDGRVYNTTEQVVWPAGSTLINVPVAYGEAGVIGNAGIGVITGSSLFREGDYTISNSAITTGRDVETDSERQARFAEFIQSLSKGTLVACLHAAKLSTVIDAQGNVFEYVTRSGVSEQPGHVSIYIYSSMGVPSAALLADGQRRIDGERDPVTGATTSGVRAAGVRVDVLPMMERAVSVSIRVKMRVGYSLTPAVTQTLVDTYNTAIRGVLPGGLLYLGDLTELMLKTPGVESIVPQTNENIICSVSEALTPGALTINLL